MICLDLNAMTTTQLSSTVERKHAYVRMESKDRSDHSHE